MPRERTGKLVPLALGLMVAAVALFGAWRLAEGLSVVLGWGALAFAVVIASGVLVVAWIAVRGGRLGR
jgi:hypothetical protein